MAFFVDTNVIVYAATDGPYREPCLDVLKAVADGQAQARTSTAVLEEVWHIELSGKVGPVSGLAAHAYDLLSPLLAVTDDTVRAALAVDVERLGANDRIHLAVCHSAGIDVILTADSDFDRAPGLRRVDPLDGRRLARLLRG